MALTRRLVLALAAVLACALCPVAGAAAAVVQGEEHMARAAPGYPVAGEFDKLEHEHPGDGEEEEEEEEADESQERAGTPPLFADAGVPLFTARAPAQALADGDSPAIVGGLSQPGLPASFGPHPPDPMGAIGPDHYVEMVNGLGVAVYSREGLGLVSGPVPASSFAGMGGGREVLDPQVAYDQVTRRWYYVFTWRNTTGTTRVTGLAYGWSKTSDPSDLGGGWCRMEISTGQDFEDRPKLGMSGTHLMFGTNVDPISGAFYSRVWTVPKPAAGSTSCPSSVAGIQSFGSVSSPLRSTDGDVIDSPVPALGTDGGTGYVVAADSRPATLNQLMVWHVGSNGALVADGNLGVNAYATPPPAPQPSGFDTLDTVDERLGQAVARTDPAAGATAVWTQHTIADPAGSGRAIVRWYELLPGSCGGGTCPASARRQQGELKDAAAAVFNAAISPTGAGNEAVIQYNVAGTGVLAQIRARSRTATMPLGSFGAETTVETSDAANDEPNCRDTRPSCRWGDYSAATPDPADPHAVWGTNQAIGPVRPNQPQWKTRNFALHAVPAPALQHSSTGVSDAGGGDGDGTIEPGEGFSLTETVANVGEAPATGLAATLAATSPGLTIGSAASAYPDVPAGGTAANATPFQATAAASVACGTTLTMRLTIDTAQGRQVVPVSVRTGATGPAATQASADVPKAIPDESEAGVSSTLALTGAGTIADLDVTVSRIAHPFVGDLRVELVGPDGTSAVLADRPGGVRNAGDDLVDTVFDDEATATIGGGTAPYTGRFRPVGARLGAFDGKAFAGTWTLRVADMAAGDTGTLQGWGLTRRAAQCTVAPNTPPAAAFTASPDPAVSGDTVTFTSTSSDSDGSIASQAWDLDGDGQFDDGSGTSESRTFSTPGSYTVSLRVTDNRGGTDTATRTITINNRAPVAAFSGPQGSVPSGQSVTFTSSSSDPDGTIVEHAWDTDDDGQFDDGAGPSVSRSFPRSGTYTVRLRVTDNRGATGVATRTVTVTNRAPAASFTGPAGSVPSGQAVTFTSTATDPDGSIAAHAWDLDDDGEFDDGTGASASRSFPRSGTYSVRLQVRDDEGATATAARTVTVTNRAPAASFVVSPAPAPSGEPVTFTSTSTDPDGSIAAQAWDLDNDGQYDDGTGASATRTFSAPGSYTVRLRVTDDEGATAATSRTATIDNRSPAASFTIAPDPAPSGQEVTFTSSSTDPDSAIASQAWDLDDGTAFDDGTGLSAARAFPRSGRYEVRLRVVDDTGAASIATRFATIANRGPAAAFDARPERALTGDVVTFDAAAASDPDGTVARYEWDLDGDGSFETDSGRTASTSRFYTTAGQVTVRLRVTDDEGASAATSRTVTIDQRPADRPDGGGGGTPPAPDPGGRPPRDATAPNGALRVPVPSLVRALRRRGLGVRLASTEAATAELRLLVGARTAQRLGLARRRATTEIGSARLDVGAGRTSAVVRLGADAARRLTRLRGAGRLARLPVTLRLVLIDAAGNRRSITVKATLAR